MTSLLSPARGTVSTETIQSRENAEIRIRAGRGPAHLDANPVTNPARTVIVIRCQYRFAAAYSSQAGSDDWSRKLQPLPASGSFFQQGRAGLLNLFGLFQAARSFVRSLRKFCQEPRSVLSVFLIPPPLRVVAHEKQQNTGVIGNVQIPVGDIQDVQR